MRCSVGGALNVDARLAVASGWGADEVAGSEGSPGAAFITDDSALVVAGGPLPRQLSTEYRNFLHTDLLPGAV